MRRSVLQLYKCSQLGVNPSNYRGFLVCGRVAKNATSDLTRYGPLEAAGAPSYPSRRWCSTISQNTNEEEKKDINDQQNDEWGVITDTDSQSESTSATSSSSADSAVASSAIPIKVNLEKLLQLRSQSSNNNNNSNSNDSNNSYSYSYNLAYSLPPEHVNTLEEVIGMSPIHWYPGHMHKAMTSLEEKIKQCHICLEVRDARIPLSSANPELENMIKRHNKRRVIVFNKADLADIRKHDREMLEDYYRQQNIPVIWTASNSTKAIRKVLDAIESLVIRKYETLPTIVLLLGYPNVGKSSVIKAMKSISSLKSKGGPKIAPEPGVTRSISGFMVSKSPPVYVLDSPGIMLPRFEKSIEGVETSLKLGITAAIKDKMVTSEVLARYILYACHVQNQHPYTWAWTRRDKDVHDKRRYFNLPAPTTDLNELLSSLAKHLTGSGDLALRGNERRNRAKDFLIMKWRSGEMGRWILDDVSKMLADRRRIEIHTRRSQGKPIKRVQVQSEVYDVPPQ